MGTMINTFPFEDLPGELQILVVELLGTAFFEEDTRRLTLSRQWYDLVLPILSRRLHIRGQKLLALAQAAAEGKFPLDGFVRRPFVKVLNLEVERNSHFWWMTEHRASPAGLCNESRLQSGLATHSQKSVFGFPEGGETDCSSVRVPRKLTSYEVDWPNLQRADVTISSTSGSLETSRLSYLFDLMATLPDQVGISLDLSHTEIFSFYRKFDLRLCHKVRKLLPRLDKLAICTMPICHEMFQLPSSMSFQPIKLEELRIYMGPLASKCRESHSEPGKLMDVHGVESICQAVTELNHRMRNPRAVKVAWVDMLSETELSYHVFDPCSIDIKDVDFEEVKKILPRHWLFPEWLGSSDF